MSIVVIGVNHRTGPLALLERLAIAPDASAEGGRSGSTQRHNIREAVVLSTCNRTEVYAVAEQLPRRLRRHPRLLLRARRPRPPTSCIPTSTASTTTRPSRHLFEVAAGLDSAVLGESEILGQVRNGVGARPARGRRQGDAQPAVPPRVRDRQAGPHRDRRSVAARRRSATPRSRWPPTGSARSPASGCSWSAPATWARASPPRWCSAGATDICVTNRTTERAAQLAERVGGRVVPFGELPTASRRRRRAAHLHRRRRRPRRRRHDGRRARSGCRPRRC